MSRRILLVRHGHSSHVHDGRWMRSSDVDLFEDAYDAAGIRDDSHPPEDLRALAASAALASSDMPRAIASLERLAPNRQFAATPLLREIRIDAPRWIPLRLPILAWDMMSYAKWRYRLAFGTEHPYLRRAHEAAEWVDRLAATPGPVVAITHGAFRILLSAALVARGWSPVRERRSYDNWSVWRFTRP